MSSSSTTNSWMHIGLHGHSMGTFSADTKGIFWQSAGNNNNSADDDIVLSRFIPANAVASPAQWTVYGRTAYVRIHNTVANSTDTTLRSFPRELRFDGFPSNDYDALKNLLQSLFQVELVRHPVSVCGASFGNVAIDAPVATDRSHQNLVFRRCLLENVTEEGEQYEPRDGEELMSIHLADVSQCVLPGNSRNEIELQFLENDTAEAGTDQLVAIRFYIPPQKKLLDDVDDEEDEEKSKEDNTSAQLLQQQILASARIKSTSGNVIAEFNEDMGTFLTPRGRYSIELYDSFLRMRGNKYDFKIKYDDISRLFLLPRPDDIHMAFVIALDRPIRQGQQRYQMLVWQTTKESSELEIHLDPQVLTTEYQDNLQPVMQGSLCNLIAKTFKIIADKKVFVPGNFANAVQQPCVKCAYKANEGHLYPLEKSFVFIHKPPLMIRFEEIESVEFQRYHNASVHHGSSTRNFDLCITLHPTMGGSSSVLADGVKEYVFSGIDRSDYPGLYNFLSGKKIRIKNLKESSEGRGKASAMDEAPKKKQAQDEEDADDDGDEDSEEDEDYGGGGDDDDEGTENSDSEEDSGDDDDDDDDDDSDLAEYRKSAAKKEKVTSQKRPREEVPSKSKSNKKSKASTKTSESAKPKKAKKDPNAPKRAMTAYLYFTSEMRSVLQKQNPSLSFGDLARLLSQKFKEISPSEKKKYEDLASAAKKKYEAEMKEYKSKNPDAGKTKAKSSSASKKPIGKKKQESESDDSSDDGDSDDDDSDE